MTTQTQASAEAALEEIQTVTAAVLPEPPAAAPTLAQADPALAHEIRRRIDELNMNDTGSIVHFGARAQNELQEISIGYRPQGAPHEECVVILMTACYADAWHAWGSPNSLREANERIDELATEAGRDPAAIMRASSLSLDDLDTARKHAEKFRDAGYGYLVCGWPEAGAAQVEAFTRDVLPDLTD